MNEALRQNVISVQKLIKTIFFTSNIWWYGWPENSFDVAQFYLWYNFVLSFVLLFGNIIVFTLHSVIMHMK